MLYATPELKEDEKAVLGLIAAAKQSLLYQLDTPRRWTGHLRRTALARAVRGSNTIEGYNITVEDTIALALDEEPLDADHATELAVRGYQRAMTYVLQRVRDPRFAYSTGLLLSLHFMLMEHDLSKNPGQWRPGWIAVRSATSGRIVHEGADSVQVPELMDELVASLNRLEKAGPRDPIISAAMAHLNLVLIHPFSDGNGRMARCLQSLVLSHCGTLEPAFSSIEEYLGRNTPTYYAELAQVGGGRWDPARDAGPWIRFCLTAHYRQVITQLRRQRETQKVWEILEHLIQQKGLPERTVLALSDAVFGWKVRNATYRAAAEVARDSASRDLKLLADAGLLLPHGEKRGRYYAASPALTDMTSGAREDGQVPDPFALERT